jgi:hypothetical protein
MELPLREKYFVIEDETLVTSISRDLFHSHHRSAIPYHKVITSK